MLAVHLHRLSRGFHPRCYESMTSRFPDRSWISFEQPRARAGEPRTPGTRDHPRRTAAAAPVLALPAPTGQHRPEGRSEGSCLTRLSFLMRSATSPGEPLRWHRQEAEGRARAAQGSSPGAAQRLLPSQLASIHGAMVRAQRQSTRKTHN